MSLAWEKPMEIMEINSKINNAEKQISGLEDRITEITQSEQQTES